MQYQQVTTDDELHRLCDELAGAETIAFDTEFVSEDTYRPQLCLVQVAVEDRLIVIDPLSIRDVRPFWQLLVSPGHETIVHAGREELRFCLQAVGKRPAGLFDVQLAAGMVGFEYPASYSNLISRLLKRTLSKGETRTDWRRRPLSKRQLDYAALDVAHLQQLRDALVERLDRLQRRPWLDMELDVWQQQVEDIESREQWRRVSGLSGLPNRSLAIVRELWRWREAEAERRDRPPRRVLRDDLLIELARRQTADPRRIRAVRGLERRQLQQYVPHLAKAIERALALPEDQLPQRPQRRESVQLNVLTQFLSTALANICRAQQIAPTIVGTVEDIRQLAAYRLNLSGSQDGAPALLEGWRAEVVGSVLDKLLTGELTMRVADPLSDAPLAINDERER